MKDLGIELLGLRVEVLRGNCLRFVHKWLSR